MNLQTNKRLIRMAQRDGFHFLAIGKDDDAPLSQTHMEARILENLGNGMNKKQFQIVPGVDQLGLTLVTRAINEIRGDKPAVYPLLLLGQEAAPFPCIQMKVPKIRYITRLSPLAARLLQALKSRPHPCSQHTG